MLIGSCGYLDSNNLVLVENDRIDKAPASVIEIEIDKEPFDLWDRIRKNLSFSIPMHYEDAEIYRERLRNNQHSVNRISKSGQLYLFHTVKRAEELNLPIELALLPFVESEFDPYAQSIYGATGIWQFLPATGKEWGLKSNWWYDGKRLMNTL